MTIKIIVIVEGGTVQNILCNVETTKVDVHVIDWDNIVADPENETERTKSADELLDQHGTFDVEWAAE